MRHITHIFLFIMLLGLTNNSALAHDIAVPNVDGVTIYYNYINNGKELAVTFKGDAHSRGDYSGHLNIPESINHNGKNLIVSAIGDDAFRGCSLFYVHMPNSITSIGESAFRETPLVYLEIPGSLTKIGRFAFWNTGNPIGTIVSLADEPVALNKVDSVFSFYSVDRLFIPFGTRTKYNEAGWLDYFEIDDVFAPLEIEGVYYTIDYSGWGNEQEAVAMVAPSPYFYSGDVTIPSEINWQGQTYTVESIGFSAFEGCYELSSIKLPNTIRYIFERAFRDCSRLTQIELPPFIEYIGNRAFQYCTQLQQVEIPNLVEEIGMYAFDGCSSLTSLILGNALQDIGNVAFWCKNLNDITCLARMPSRCDPDVFPSEVRQYATLHVPEGRELLYKEASGWKNFKNIVGENENVMLTIKDGEQGELQEMVKRGDFRSITIRPTFGYKIHSVTFNNEDVTKQLSTDGIFVTPFLTTDVTLYVVFEQELDAVKNLQKERHVHISARKGEVLVDGLPAGELIEVYTIDGQLCSSTRSSGSPTSIHLNTDQTYVVKAGDKVVKVRL